MNVTSTSSITTQKNVARRENKKPNTSFGAGAGPLVGFATFIENNGFLGEFLTVDTVGMATPRTVQGYTRNSKELGHPNYKAGREELVREVLSGPAIFVVPLLAVGLAGLIRGKAAKITTQTIESFGEVMKKASPNISDIKQSKEVRKNFLDTLFDDAFKEHTGKGSKEKIDSIREVLEDLLDGKIKTKEANKKLTETVSSLNRSNGKFIDNTLTIKMPNGHKIEATELTNDIPNYLSDFSKKAQKNTKEKDAFIDKFNKSSQLARKITNIFAVSTLFSFLLIVPKLYQVDKKFPGSDGIKGDAKPQNPNTPAQDSGDRKDVSFKGRTPKAAETKKFGEKAFDWIAKQCNVESNGSLTRAMFTIAGGVMLGGRYTKSRDEDEKREVLVRDIPGVALAAFGAPALNNSLGYTSTKLSGIPIVTMKEGKKGLFGSKFASQRQISDWFSNLGELKNPLISLSETVEKHGGDIRKVMTKFGLKEEFENVVSNKDATNKEIIEELKKAKGSDLFEKLEDKIKNVASDNKVVKVAKRNQALIKVTGIGLTAALLGYILPRINIVNTRKKYMNQAATAQPKTQQTQQTKTANEIKELQAHKLNSKQKEAFKGFNI